MPTKLRNIAGGILGCAWIALTLASPAPAQNKVEEYAPGDFFIEGIRAYCGDFTVYVHPKFETLIDSPDITRININGPVFDALPPGLRLFAFYQTCGMVFYDGDVAQADAGAARSGISFQWLSADDIDAMCSTSIMVDAGWKMAPDAKRCEAIAAVMLATMK